MPTRAEQAALGEVPYWTMSNACQARNHTVCPGTFMNYRAPGISGSDPGFFHTICKCIVCRHGREEQ